MGWRRARQKEGYELKYSYRLRILNDPENQRSGKCRKSILDREDVSTR